VLGFENGGCGPMEELVAQVGHVAFRHSKQRLQSGKPLSLTFAQVLLVADDRAERLLDLAFDSYDGDAAPDPDYRQEVRLACGSQSVLQVSFSFEETVDEFGCGEGFSCTEHALDALRQAGTLEPRCRESVCGVAFAPVKLTLGKKWDYVCGGANWNMKS
jgi:hypothetical protein